MPRNPNGGGDGNGPYFPQGNMMFPPGFPLIIQQPNQQPQQPNPQDPPLRVQVAMVLASVLTRKTQPIILPNGENSFEKIDGQKLTPEEETARKTAMSAMSHYFAGSLVPDTWEKESLSQSRGVQTLQHQCCCIRPDPRGGFTTQSNCPFCDGEGLMDVVVRFPRRISSDADGNMIELQQPTGRKAIATVPTPGGRGRRRKAPLENEDNEE
jgi:hypothetical protein